MAHKIIVYTPEEILELVLQKAKEDGYEVAKDRSNYWIIDGDSRYFNNHHSEPNHFKADVRLALQYVKTNKPNV